MTGTISIVILALVVLLAVYFLTRRQADVLRNHIDESLRAITSNLIATQTSVGERLDSATKVVGDLRERLGKLAEATERIREVGKDISQLHDILRAPKLRGVLGEFFLGDLLAQMLPATHFTLQHRFESGETVDAVVRLGAGLVPVDSKFPLENCVRMFKSATDEERNANRRKFVADVRKHIDSISRKYILPDEGTFDFALMYIPAENIYYETIIRDESFGEEKGISTFALEKRVIPVSPNSLYAYLQAIVLGLKGLRIEQSAREIIDHLGRLQHDFQQFQGDFDTLGTHISHAANKYDEARKRMEKFGGKLEGVGGFPASEEGDSAVHPRLPRG